MRTPARDNRSIVEGVIWKQLLIYFFPILLGTFFQQLYNTVDAMVVGHFLGKEALAAVGGATGTIINLLVRSFVGLSSGATVVISQFYGKGDEECVSRVVHTSIALSLIGGVLLTVIGMSGARWALEAMDTPADVMDGANDYIMIYFSGVILNLLYNMGSGILHATGDSRRPMIYLIVCCLVNIVLDIMFVGWLNMGISGVALATVLSQGVSAALVMAALMRTDECCKFVPARLRMDRELLGRVLRIGFPASIEAMMYSVSKLIMQSYVNALGTDAMAAWTVFGKLDSIIGMVVGAFGVSITTFVGQNWGARKPERVQRSIRTGMAMSMVSTIVISGAMLLCGRSLIRLFSGDEAVIMISLAIMYSTIPLYFTHVAVEILSGAMRGMGNSFGPMLIICFGICVLRTVWLFTLVPVYSNIVTIAVSYPMSWVATSAAITVYYLRWSRWSGLHKLLTERAMA